MEEKFYKWHTVKGKIDQLDSSHTYFKERDIWWCYLGENIGREQNGKGDEFSRPVLVLKKYTKDLSLVIPLSTQIRFGTFYFFLLSESNRIRLATLSQMKIIDSKRLINKIDTISVIEFELIKKKVIDLIR